MFVTQKGLNTPTRMLQGVTNTTSYFQGALERTLGDFVRGVCLVYVDDVIIWGRNVWELMDHFSWDSEENDRGWPVCGGSQSYPVSAGSQTVW